MKQVIERLYSASSMLNDDGQYAFYGRVGGCIITGNEDGIKHCAMNVLYSLQHVGFTIPPQADAGWIGEAGPGPSYLDKGSGGPENDFTNRNTTFMTYNLLHRPSSSRMRVAYRHTATSAPCGTPECTRTRRTPAHPIRSTARSIDEDFAGYREVWIWSCDTSRSSAPCRRPAASPRPPQSRPRAASVDRPAQPHREVARRRVVRARSSRRAFDATGDLVLARAQVVLPAMSGLLDDAARLSNSESRPRQVSIGASTDAVLGRLIHGIGQRYDGLNVSTHSVAVGR